jgi:hypothetical protein
MCCKQLPLNYNEFHVLSAAPRDMECDMKKLPDKAEMVEWIVTALGPLRKPRSAQARAGLVERMIERLRVGYGHQRPDIRSIKKITKNLSKALEPLSDAMPLLPIFIKGCDRKHIWLRELRSALDGLASLEDWPSPKLEDAKYCAAFFAHRLVKEFSQKPPSTSPNGQVRAIATLLYQACSGEKGVKLKRQTDAVCRNGKHEATDTFRFGPVLIGLDLDHVVHTPQPIPPP